MVVVEIPGRQLNASLCGFFASNIKKKEGFCHLWLPHLTTPVWIFLRYAFTVHMFSFLHAVVSFSKREYELETPIHVLLITELKKIQVLEVNSSYTISAGDGDDNRSREKREKILWVLWVAHLIEFWEVGNIISLQLRTKNRPRRHPPRHANSSLSPLSWAPSIKATNTHCP